jgi:hypothetical protein
MIFGEKYKLLSHYNGCLNSFLAYGIQMFNTRITTTIKADLTPNPNQLNSVHVSTVYPSDVLFLYHNLPNGTDRSTCSDTVNSSGMYVV